VIARAEPARRRLVAFAAWPDDEGGKEAIEALGCTLRRLFTREELEALAG
jgi:hypothetical protein